MSREAEIVRLVEEQLGGRPVPGDLRRLAAIQAARPENPAWGVDPLFDIEAILFEPGETDPLLDHSYLNDRDRADPDIMANVAAIKAVLRHLAVVARTTNGNIAGYWVHPDEPRDALAVVQYDTEGQFNILPGLTLLEALIGDAACGDDARFTELAERFAALGLPVAAPSRDDLVTPEVAVHPGVLHEKLYDEARAVRKP